ncbi:hypothetical protein N7490_003014 [Penicillium lividum]|nr:hypothetical protein N7490_003014 [Penicillium lividum]
MGAPRYQSNRPSQKSIFPNDFTCKSTLENDRRKLEAIAAAKLQKSQAAEALELERRQKEQNTVLKIKDLEEKTLNATLKIKDLEEKALNAALKIKDLEEKKTGAEHMRDEWIEKFNAKSAASDKQIRDLEDEAGRRILKYEALLRENVELKSQPMYPQVSVVRM